MELSAFFQAHPRAALAFSGGVDSAYLLYAALRLGADVGAYFVKTPFQPAFELEDAQRLAGELKAPLRVIRADVLSQEVVAQNPADRCYFCKRFMLSAILARAGEDGYGLLLDGTNASDRGDDRPGMRALSEMGVRSPLRECGLSKGDIRRLSHEAGLFTHDKPAYACLATRIPTGEPITREKLARTEWAEAFLRAQGFRDLRVRMAGEAAKLELRAAQFPLLLEKRQAILGELKKGYGSILLDLEARDE